MSKKPMAPPSHEEQALRDQAEALRRQAAELEAQASEMHYQRMLAAASYTCPDCGGPDSCHTRDCPSDTSI